MPDIKKSCAVAFTRERNNATHSESATIGATASAINASKPASLQELRAQLRAQLTRNYSGNRDDGKQAELRSCATATDCSGNLRAEPKAAARGVFEYRLTDHGPSGPWLILITSGTLTEAETILRARFGDDRVVAVRDFQSVGCVSKTLLH